MKDVPEFEIESYTSVSPTKPSFSNLINAATGLFFWHQPTVFPTHAIIILHVMYEIHRLQPQKRLSPVSDFYSEAVNVQTNA
jgi:hypothetical protein